MFKNLLSALSRRQTFLVVVWALAVLMARVFLDRNGLYKTASLLVDLATGIVVLAVIHWVRKRYLDHGFDLKDLFANASTDAKLKAVAIFFLGICYVFGARAEGVPAQAYQHLPVLAKAIDADWADIPDRTYPAALIEHESGCPSIKSMCWNPHARLKTKREEGAGLAQLTRAYSADGAIRFDKLAELVERYPQLQGLSWANVYDRPDLQMEAMLLMVKDGFEHFDDAATPADALMFTDAGYNGGDRGVQREQRACHLAPGCDPARWLGHVERFCMKSKAPLYGNRSACDINRHHVVDVFRRMAKYRGLV